jgi:hypothetical protein
MKTKILYKFKNIRSSKGNQTAKAKLKWPQRVKALKTMATVCTTKILKVHYKSHTSTILKQITSTIINNSITAIFHQNKLKEW